MFKKGSKKFLDNRITGQARQCDEGKIKVLVSYFSLVIGQDEVAKILNKALARGAILMQ